MSFVNIEAIITMSAHALARPTIMQGLLIEITIIIISLIKIIILNRESDKLIVIEILHSSKQSLIFSVRKPYLMRGLLSINFLIEIYSF